MAEKKDKKNFMARLFDTQRVGPGVKKNEAPLKFDLIGFFKFYWRNIDNVLKFNLLYLFGNFPIFFALYAMTGNLNTNSFGAASPLFGPLNGAMQLMGDQVNPAFMSLWSIHGVQATVSVMSTATIVLFALSALVIITCGLVNVGVTRLIRSLILGEPIFLLHDFFESIKKNWKPALIMGFLDCVIIFMLFYNITLTYFNFNVASAFRFTFYGNIMLGLVYSIMRFYTYIQLITFKLNLWQIFKNAFIFTVINGKRNLVALLGCAICLLFNYFMMIFFFPIGILLPFIFTFSTCALMGAYAAWPKIKEVLVDPLYQDVKPAANDDDVIFRDRG